MTDSKSLTVVCGPTATGKTNYALDLSHKINGELISADSRQLYKYLTIGTGKDIPKNARFVDKSILFESNNKDKTIGYYPISGTRIWLYDMLTPDQQLSAYEFAVFAREIIKNIWSRGKTPLLVGGTGLYINAVIDGFDTQGYPPNKKLRSKLNNLSIDELQKTLATLSPSKLKGMNNSDKNNPRRIIRAIEIETHRKLQPTKKGHNNIDSISNITRFIGLKMNRSTLYKKIDGRVDNRIKQGVVDELKRVLDLGYSWDDPGLNTLGYKQLREHIENKESLDSAIAKWKYAEHNYARRQLTWFNKDKRIKWVMS